MDYKKLFHFNFQRFTKMTFSFWSLIFIFYFLFFNLKIKISRNILMKFLPSFSKLSKFCFFMFMCSLCAAFLLFPKSFRKYWGFFVVVVCLFFKLFFFLQWPDSLYSWDYIYAWHIDYLSFQHSVKYEVVIHLPFRNELQNKIFSVICNSL